MHPATRARAPWTLLAMWAITVPLWAWRVWQGTYRAHWEIAHSQGCSTYDNFSCESIYRAAYGYFGLNIALAVAFVLLTALISRGHGIPRYLMSVLYGVLLCVYLLAIAVGFRGFATLASAAAVLAIIVLTCLPPTSRWIEHRRKG